MPPEPRVPPGADMVGFVQELTAFVGLDEAELALVRHTAPVVLRHERALTDALYEHFLKFPATARFFLKEDGTPDTQRLERRKHSLGRWLHATAEAAMTHEFVYYLLAVSLSHSHRQHGPGGVVPPQFMVAAMSLAQTALARIFQQELENLQQALEASIVWNKVLLVHLNVLLLGYLLPPPRTA
jgi:hemoglobin-like flavoprotein